MGLFSRSEPASHFPEALGMRLSTGDEVRFPEDLPADATLLIVAFRDDLDPLSDQWARLGDRLAESYGDRVATWELPVVNKKLKMFGKLATVGIRGQVEGDAERDRTVPLYVDTKAFRKELGLKSQSDVYAFLVGRGGEILWRGEGDIDMEEVEALERAVSEHLSATPPPDEAASSEGDEPAPEAVEEEPVETPATDLADPGVEPDEDATPLSPRDGAFKGEPPRAEG